VHQDASEASSPGDDSGGGGDDGSASCNSLTELGQVIAQQNVAQSAPVPAGGTIMDGTYVETADTVFTGDGGLSGPTGTHTQITFALSGANFQEVALYGNPLHGNGNYAVDGGSVAFNFTCHEGAITGINFVGFDSDPDAGTFRLYRTPSPEGTKVTIFQKQ
jgi:hypothetical protein